MGSSLLSIGSEKRSTNFNTKQKGKMSAERKISARKLSMDMQRKLSAISNCSDVSNLSVMLGMEPNDFKSTIQNILELDLGEDWPESEDESEEICGSESVPADIINKVVSAERKNSQTVRIVPDQRKSSTGSNVSTDSLDEAESFQPVDIDVDSLKTVLTRYRKISMSKLAKK